MIKVKFVGARPRDVAPATGAREFRAEPGEVYEVDDKTGHSLLDQPAWFEHAAEPKRAPQKKEKD